MSASNPGLVASGRLLRGGFALEVQLALPAHGVSAVFGPSGTGKTSLLRAFAGLDRLAGGYLRVNDEVWQDDASGHFLPPHRRAVGYVAQGNSLFPGRSVRRNLHYGWQRAGRPASLDPVAMARRFGIDALLDRDAATLSGGEAQRVALARALLSAPRLLLLDEPLSALDTARKAELLPYLERLQDELSIPVIYVSHAMDEVARLADFLVLLESGQVRAQGPLQALCARTDLAAQFAHDPAVVLDARVTEHDAADDLSRIAFAGGSLWVAQACPPPGQRLRCRIHARDVSVSLTPPGRSSILNSVPVVIAEIAPGVGPAQVLLRLEAGQCSLLASITTRSLRLLSLAVGTRAWAQVKAVALLE